jgi:hypothetical protein
LKVSESASVYNLADAPDDSFEVLKDGVAT